LESTGYVWYADLPASVTCSCGKNTLDLSYARANLHAYLGRHFRPNGDVSLVPVYQSQALQHVLQALVALVNKDSTEEELQQFLTANPVVLGQFSPQRLQPKARILTRYATDFAILNHRAELILIELERPSTRIMKKDGGVSAELQTPLNQVTDWLHELDEHRAAVLSGLSLLPSDVAKIRGVVIAGRKKDYDSEALRKLKKRVFDQRIDVMTYDDLVNGYAAIIRNFAP